MKIESNHIRIRQWSGVILTLIFTIVFIACGNLYEYENKDTSLATIKIDYRETETTPVPEKALIPINEGHNSPQIGTSEPPRLKPMGNFYALIVGNNHYQGLSSLETAIKDAKDVAGILHEKYGFKVHLLLDANRHAILSAVNSFRRKLTAVDSFLLYYAGHGLYDKAADRAYWLPIDAVLDDDTNWIIADTITSNLKRIDAAHILIVADSCYSGTFTRGVESLPKIRDQRDRYLTKMAAKKSRTLIASGGNEPVSDSGGGGNSVFANAFLKALNSIDKNIFSAEELFYQNLKEQVAGNAAQTPEYKVLRNSGHDGGDFVFFQKE
jgi:uncharacterized caspase-like protein